MNQPLTDITGSQREILCPNCDQVIVTITTAYGTATLIDRMVDRPMRAHLKICPANQEVRQWELKAGIINRTQQTAPGVLPELFQLGQGVDTGESLTTPPKSETPKRAATASRKRNGKRK